MNIKPNTSLYKILEVGKVCSPISSLPKTHCGAFWIGLWGIYCILGSLLVVPVAISALVLAIYSVFTGDLFNISYYPNELMFIPLNAVSSLVPDTVTLAFLPVFVLCTLISVAAPIIVLGVMVVLLISLTEEACRCYVRSRDEDVSNNVIVRAMSESGKVIKTKVVNPIATLYKAHKDKYCIAVTYYEKEDQ